MLTLDEGSWTAYTCLARSGVWFATTFVALAGFAYVYFLLASLKIWGERAFKPVSVLPVERKALPILVAFGLLVNLSVSAFVAVKRDRDILFLRGDELVERGCRLLRPFEDVYNFSSVKAEFKGNVLKSRATPGIEIRTVETERVIGVRLKNAKYVENLFAAFPLPMHDYVDTLKNKASLAPYERKALTWKQVPQGYP